ncbi:murein hydrolase activator EnvC [Ciceribacter sp. L1K23]|uniref:murein hydrolase activator EnvC family protein n=1 Tax=Ciceribacter sp. L1K23 TaxID=2820276 RepID=UPI001B8315F8|nr:murein hydrolase activator EnvC [Ciceribacter sp. L1K23]MBR0557755.1 murein hydrolase activator EnvC [Ciceribacter sp. L1K23]
MALLLGGASSVAQQPPTPAATTSPATASSPGPDAPAAVDPTDTLQKKREEVARELKQLSDTMELSATKSAELEQKIAALDKTSETLRTALIESAARRKELERQVAESEEKLAGYRVREDEIRLSFRERRAVLAEVLAALQRMGRNPPPALLVTPEDALSSVRTAILLGAVVPGIRQETERLAGDLQELVNLRKSVDEEKTAYLATMTNRQEEERRMDLLLAENDRLAKINAAELERQRRRSEELAAKATGLEGLITSLESEIASVRDAMRKARDEEERLRTEAETQGRDSGQQTLPDKNRITPAYLFSELQGKLELPATGEVLRRFGDPDGTGHEARGMVVASMPGAVVTAPADAWVVFAGEFRSYGQMVILNAGDGYHIVLSGMDRVNTRQGSFVLSGEPLATMGEKRVASATALALETDRPTLYIEFRKDGVPVDSRPWWAEKDAGKAGNDT